MMPNWLIVGGMCLCAVAAVAQETPKEDAAVESSQQSTPAEKAASEVDLTDVPLQDALEVIRKDFKLPALTGAIVTPAGLQEMATVGVRKYGDSTAATDQDLWHLGSCTKAMTATLMGILVQEGLLSWDSRLVDVFPEMQSTMSEQVRQITLRHLLTHRSGLPANGPWRKLGEDRTTTEQRMELLREMAPRKLDHDPGSHYEYSNVGYALAGLMAETVTRQSWEELLTHRVFQPLQMDAVGFGVPGTLGETDQPWGHHATWLGLGPLKAVQLDNAAALGPAGTVHASLESWAKFIALHLAPNNELISSEIWETLHTPAGDDYAMGWVVAERGWAQDESKQGLALTHSGSNTVNFCVCWLAPHRDFAVIAATNSGQSTAARGLDKVASVLIKRYLK